MPNAEIDPVTPEDIRLALGELDASGLSDDVIEQQIEMAEIVVDANTVDRKRVPPDVLRYAIIEIAKYRTYVSNRQAFVQRVQSSTDTTAFDLNQKVSALRRDHQSAISLLRRNDRPKTVTLGKR